MNDPLYVLCFPVSRHRFSQREEDEQVRGDDRVVQIHDRLGEVADHRADEHQRDRLLSRRLETRDYRRAHHADIRDQPERPLSHKVVDEFVVRAVGGAVAEALRKLSKMRLKDVVQRVGTGAEEAMQNIEPAVFLHAHAPHEAAVCAPVVVEAQQLPGKAARRFCR